MPGGKIAVYSGLVDAVHPSDDELAAVMGHEIAHALREHGREQPLRDQQIALASILVGAALKSEEAMKTTGRIGQIGYGFKYSRGAESEADLMGLELAARAGYDPCGGDFVEQNGRSWWWQAARVPQHPPIGHLSCNPERDLLMSQLSMRLPAFPLMQVMNLLNALNPTPNVPWSLVCSVRSVVLAPSKSASRIQEPSARHWYGRRWH